MFVCVCHVCFSDTVHYAHRMDEGTSVDGWVQIVRPPNPAKYNVSRRTPRSGDPILQPAVVRRRMSRTKRCASCSRRTWRNSVHAKPLLEDDELAKRVSRAEALVHIGEVSSARQAFVSGARGRSNSQCVERSDQTTTPPTDAAPQNQALFNLDEFGFCRNLRSARRGAAGGPSGTPFLTCLKFRQNPN